MNVARLAVMGVALAAAAGAGFLALSLSGGEAPEPVIITAAPAAPPVKLTEVLVTEADLPMGATIGDTLDWQDWPVEAVDETFILKSERPDAIEALKGRFARGSFFAGEPIREDKLIKAESGFMSAILPAGMRAMAIQISAETAAGGFILPNDHADVIMTRRLPSVDGEGERFVTETVMENLRVLAIDQTIEEQNGSKVVVGSTATVAVTPEQAEALTAAQHMAERLVLSLRSLADSVPGTPGYAAYLLAKEQRDQKTTIRIVRHGETSDITTEE